jgi:16S rRNA (guanine527-N7)-methyltransferase
VSGFKDSSTNASTQRSRVADEVEAILGRSVDLGFLGRMPVAEQIDHALGFVVSTESALGRSPDSVVDLGTGGGVPGLILLSCWPDCRFLLVDASERRTEFLAEEITAWRGDEGVDVLRARAEEVGGDDHYRGQFETVTSRSFGSPAVTAECGAPLLAEGGLMVVSEPPDDPVGNRWPAAGLAEVGLTAGSRIRFDGRFGYQVLVKSGSTPDRYPRRTGIPAKRPLF